MSAAAARTGIIERIKTIQGLRVLSYEPTTIQATPLAFVFYAGATQAQRGQVLVSRWRFGVRVCVAFQDNLIAEDQLVAYADSIPAAINADRTLGNRANVTGIVEQSAEGPDGYYDIAGVLFRSCVFRFDVIDKT